MIMEKVTNSQRIIELFMQGKKGTEIAKILQLNSAQPYMVINRYKERIQAGMTIEQLFNKKEKVIKTKAVKEKKIKEVQVDTVASTESILTSNDSSETESNVTDTIIKKETEILDNELKKEKERKPKTNKDLKQVAPTKQEISLKEINGTELDILLNSIAPAGLIFEDGGTVTPDRGCRIDFGGGVDGEGWLSSEQVTACAAPFHKKWDPKINFMIEKAAEKGFLIKGRMEYGEKGSIFLIFK